MSKAKKQKQTFRIVNPGRALVVFFCLGIGIAFGLVAVSGAIASLREDNDLSISPRSTDRELNSTIPSARAALEAELDD